MVWFSATGVPGCGDWLVIRHDCEPTVSFITSCPSGAIAEMFTQAQGGGLRQAQVMASTALETFDWKSGGSGM
jgi:hypothetical protein